MRTREDAKRSFGCLLIFCGLLFGLFTVWALLESSLFMARSERAEGVVTRVIEWTEWREGSGHVPLRVAVVRFAVQDREVEARIGGDSVFAEGTKVPVWYRTDEPEVARLDEGLWTAYRTPVFSGIIAFTAVLTGVLIGRQSASDSGRK